MTETFRWPDLLARTYDVVRAPVAHLDEPLLDRPTPCSDWSVRQLLGHVVGTLHMFATAAGASPPVADDGAAAPIERFDAAASRNLAAWRALADPRATVTLPFGDFPAEFAAAMNQLDALVHGWDLAAALGLALPFSDELAQPALATAEIRCRREPRTPAWGTEVPARGNSPQEKLLALTGRDTSAWPGAIWVAGSLVTVKPSHDRSSPASAVEIWEREGSGPPRHVHAEHDEMWYVLEGRFTFALGDRELTAGPGDVVVGPRGVPHTFRADTADARLLDVHMPGGFERFFIQAGVPATELVPPAPAAAGGAPGVRAMIEAFGASVVGPPLGH